MKKKKTYAKKHLYLLEIYTCYARFYEMTVSGKYNCRDVLDYNGSLNLDRGK